MKHHIHYRGHIFNQDTIAGIFSTRTLSLAYIHYRGHIFQPDDYRWHILQPEADMSIQEQPDTGYRVKLASLI
jgi:hypothetical protein